MHVWAIANQKGGVGKTTTTVALGSLLAERGSRVLMLDLDPQGSLTTYFRLDPETVQPSSYDLFVRAGEMDARALLACVQPTAYPNLSLLPANTALAALERSLTGKEGMGLAVSRGLALLWEEFDYVLIDSPPTLGVLLINALAACELILIPVQTEFLAIKGLERMLNTLRMVMHSRHKPLRYLIVPTLFDRRTQASMSSLRSLRSTYPDQVWHSAIPIDTRLRDASARGVTPGAIDADSRGIRAYASLLKTVVA
jgi:chromosome partitioning protein